MKTRSVKAGPAQTNHTPRIIALGVLALLLLGALTRGHAQSANRSATDPVGLYTLSSVDGKPVPCTINHEGRVMEVLSGTFIISTNNQITSVMTVSVGDRKNIRIETHATFKLKNSELSMKWKNAGTTKGGVVGQTFTMTNEGMVYLYQR